MEAVDELEPERDQQRDEEQQEGRVTGDGYAARIDIGVDAVGDKQQDGGDDTAKNNGGEGINGTGEIRSLMGGRFYRAG